MRILLLPLLMLATPAAAETRCGWWFNPSAGNEYLVDGDAAWVLTEQGREAPEGYALLEDIDASEGSEGVETAPGYGYSCACLEVETDAASHHVTRVLSPGRFRPLSACEADLADQRPDA